MSVCVCVSVYICVCLCVYEYIYCIYSMCVCVCACVCISECVCVCVCACACVWLYVNGACRLLMEPQSLKGLPKSERPRQRHHCWGPRTVGGPRRQEKGTFVSEQILKQPAQLKTPFPSPLPLLSLFSPSPPLPLLP